MAGQEPEQLDLRDADNALERGDYGQALELLGPLAEVHPLNSSEGPQIRLLMITALMGQGQDDQAIKMCRLLSRCRDASMRQQAKQLLTILEAPSLERPERWSMRMPELEMNATGSGAAPRAQRRRSRRPPPPPPPPTGPTQAPSAGFAVLVITVLLGITLLLSGCVRIDTDLDIKGPNRLALNWEIQSDQERSLPWQAQFTQTLKHEIPGVTIEQAGQGHQRFKTAPASSEEVADQLTTLLNIAGETAGVVLPPAQLSLVERNWIVGVHQTLAVVIDLQSLPEIPGLELNLNVNHGREIAHLQSGQQAVVQLSAWSWSPLGLGSLVVLLLLGISMLLQTIRRQLGFGFPELPS